MPTNPPNRLTRVAPLLALVAVAAVYALRLGDLGFTEPDEARYAAVARDMLATRDFIAAIREGRSTLLTAGQHREVLSTALAAQISAREDRVVRPVEVP